MRLLVVGNSVEDHLIKGGKEVIQPGGIYYTCLGLLKVKNSGDEVFLHTKVKPGDNMFSAVYSKFNTGYMEYSDIIPSVYLTIYDDGRERDERYGEGIKSKLDVPKSYGKTFDGALINMITGFDISPDDLISIRESTAGPVYLDLHSLSRGFNERNEREFRPVPDKQKWLRNIDILQTNEYEILTLSEEGTEPAAVNDVLNGGIKILIVTKAEKGARVYYKYKNEVESAFISAVKVPANNKVGCGDIFGAVFFYNYINCSDLMQALNEAVNIAGGAVSDDLLVK